MWKGEVANQQQLRAVGGRNESSVGVDGNVERRNESFKYGGLSWWLLASASENGDA
jgi:hypothetical protein